MWMPHAGLVWDMKSETLNISGDALGHLERMELDIWQLKYQESYQDWLEDKSNLIYDLNGDLLKSIISLIDKANNANNSFKFYYWFDIDRTYNWEYKWERCPLTDTPLIDLGPEYPSKNRLVSIERPLVFPSI